MSKTSATTARLALIAFVALNVVCYRLYSQPPNAAPDQMGRGGGEVAAAGEAGEAAEGRRTRMRLCLKRSMA